MKHIKMISAIIIAAILCAGCAETKDESSVPEVTTTAATTTEATTTAATTTTVTEATTTVSTEESTKPDTVTPDTSNPSVNDEPMDTTPEDQPDTPNTNTAGDIQNPDGTYTQDYSSGEYSVPECVVDTIPAEWFNRTERQANPSMIPYSQITVENAHQAFPYTGWIGTSQAVLWEDTGSVAETGPDMSPGYIEVLPTDSRETIEWKIRANTLGTDDTQFDYDQTIEDSCLYDRPHHFFASEADYKEFLAERQRLKDDHDQRVEQGRQDLEDGKGILGDLTEEEAYDILFG